MKNSSLKHIDLSSIKDPSFLKELSIKELELLSSDIKEEIIKQVAKNGGHLSSNLGSTDAIIALCYVFDFAIDKILFDVGHQAYAYKILTGRSLENLRNEGGVSGFLKRSESKYDYLEAGHSSTSISAAYGLAVARDLNNENYDIVSFIGDASMANGVSFEGLNNLSFDNHKMIIVLNDNDMSITKPTGGLANLFRKISDSQSYQKVKYGYVRFLNKTKVGKFLYKITSNFKNMVVKSLIPPTFFENLSLRYMGPIYGHDIKKLIKYFNKAKKLKQPVVVHIKTIKGEGYKYAELDKNGTWHGVEPFDIESGKPLKVNGNLTYQKLYADEVYDILKEDQKAILVCPATEKGSALERNFKDFPNQCYDVGICEEHSLIMALGLHLGGYKPIVSIYSTFLQRAYDQLNHDLARTNADILLLVDRAGMPGHDGETHQGSFDESFLYDLPNVTITMSATLKTSQELIKEGFNSKCVFVIRYPKDYVNQVDDYPSINNQKWPKLISKNSKKCLVSFGNNGYQVYKLLKQNNIDCDYYDAVYIKPIPLDYVNQLIKYEEIIIYDSYANKSGFCLHLQDLLICNNFKGKIKIFAIEDKYYSHKDVNKQLQESHILPIDIFNYIK